MRHQQNARSRGRHRNNGGHNNHGNHGNHGGGNNGNRRINPKVHSFDSNGPDVRIRGNAYQVTEKYQSLARDATLAGDRVLAESYYQHAEHYQRLINEINEENARLNPQHHQQNGQNPTENGGAGEAEVSQAGGQQSDVQAEVVTETIERRPSVRPVRNDGEEAEAV